MQVWSVLCLHAVRLFELVMGPCMPSNIAVVLSQGNEGWKEFLIMMNFKKRKKATYEQETAISLRLMIQLFGCQDIEQFRL